jgi:hypothetical protein
MFFDTVKSTGLLAQSSLASGMLHLHCSWSPAELTTILRRVGHGERACVNRSSLIIHIVVASLQCQLLRANFPSSFRANVNLMTRVHAPTMSQTLCPLHYHSTATTMSLHLFLPISVLLCMNTYMERQVKHS